MAAGWTSVPRISIPPWKAVSSTASLKWDQSWGLQGQEAGCLGLGATFSYYRETQRRPLRERPDLELSGLRTCDWQRPSGWQRRASPGERQGTRVPCAHTPVPLGVPLQSHRLCHMAPPTTSPRWPREGALCPKAGQASPSTLHRGSSVTLGTHSSARCSHAGFVADPSATTSFLGVCEGSTDCRAPPGSGGHRGPGRAGREESRSTRALL